jgi:[ribosomal protein S5]-alanine N-acetyltransferase
MAPFNPFPLLETPRITLRQLTYDDLDVTFRILADPEVVRYMGRAPYGSMEEARDRINKVVTGVEAGSTIRWGFVLRESGELIGSGGFHRWNAEHRWAEIGYELAPAHWGKGLVPEALTSMIRFGFDRMELHRVEANIDPANSASRRVLEKLGFVREGLQRENWFYNGKYTDTGHYGLLLADFNRALVGGLAAPRGGPSRPQ